MRIYATFANFSYDHDVVELVHAWDEYSRDSNDEGYDRTLRESLESYGSDLHRHVTVQLEVNMTPIYAALDPDIQLNAEISAISPPEPNAQDSAERKTR